MSVQYVRGSGGRFAGSTAGRSAPTPNPVVAKAAAVLNETAQPHPVAASYAVFHGPPKGPLPEWLEEAPFDLRNASVSEDFAVLTDYTTAEGDVTVGDRSRPAVFRTDSASLLLRAEEVGRTTFSSDRWEAVYAYPAYRQADGSCIATHVHRDLFTRSHTNGVITSDGTFVADPGAFSSTVRDQVGEPGCPIFDALDRDAGAVEDWNVRTRSTRDGQVTGLLIEATCEEREMDFRD